MSYIYALISRPVRPQALEKHVWHLLEVSANPTSSHLLCNLPGGFELAI